MSSEDKSAISEAVHESGELNLDRAREKAKQTIEQLSNVTLNIAVTGKTGSGKSSFVNAILGLRVGDVGAAATGVTETTLKPTKYEHPTIPNVKIWDLPGIGSPNFKADKYLKQVNFTDYDFFIIITSERFMQNDFLLAKEIRKLKKKFYFVRSKIDIDVDSAEFKKSDKKMVLDLIRQDCLTHLSEMGVSEVFLISSVCEEKYDFEKLQNKLLEELPAHKRSSLLQAWPVSSAACLQKKIRLFKDMTWAAALASAGVAVSPVPGVSVVCDGAIVFLFLTKCYYAFGLDVRSLKRLSEKVSKPLQEYRDKSKFAHAIQNKALDTLNTCATVVTLAAVKDVLCLLPGVGNAVAGALSFASIVYLLREGINELAKTAQEIRRVAGLDAV